MEPGGASAERHAVDGQRESHQPLLTRYGCGRRRSIDAGRDFLPGTARDPAFDLS
jgi:hypothetical protein